MSCGNGQRTFKEEVASLHCLHDLYFTVNGDMLKVLFYYSKYMAMRITSSVILEKRTYENAAVSILAGYVDECFKCSRFF